MVPCLLSVVVLQCSLLHSDKEVFYENESVDEEISNVFHVMRCDDPIIIGNKISVCSVIIPYFQVMESVKQLFSVATLINRVNLPTTLYLVFTRKCLLRFFFNHLYFHYFSRQTLKMLSILINENLYYYFYIIWLH